jgi:hypothetical protein
MVVRRDVGTITVRYRTGVANVFTILAAVLGPVFLLVALLLPAKPHGRDSLYRRQVPHR